MTLFSLNGYDHCYGQSKVLLNLSLTIAQGERIAIVGQSGVGKTTLLKVLATQHPNDIAFCAQENRLIHQLSAYNNIYIGQLDRHSGWRNLLNLIKPNPSAWAEVSKIAASLELEPQLKAGIDQLSGGQQQRVTIGRAFYQQRPIFFGDEPVANLDPLLADRVITTILDRHPTCVIALHDRQLALKHFDRIIGLKNGQVELDCATANLQLTDLNPLYLPAE